jgi:acyl carrier protein
MPALDKQTEQEIRDLVYGYFSEECDVDLAQINDDTDIIEDLEGDSLMLLALLEMVRKKYGLSIELKTLGNHLMKKPADTVGQVVELTKAVVQYGDDIVNMDL